jgi:hypothetical protein
LSEQIYIEAEKVTPDSPFRNLGPVEFKNVEYLKAGSWHPVTSFLSSVVCQNDENNGIYQACVDPYGIAAVGPNEVVAGTGVAQTPDMTLLWATANSSIYVDSFSLQGGSSQYCGWDEYYHFILPAGARLTAKVSSDSSISFYIMSSADYKANGGDSPTSCTPSSYGAMGVAFITSSPLDYVVPSNGKYYLVFWNSGSSTANVSFALIVANNVPAS